MQIAAEFVVGAVGRGDFPADGLPELALAGRSNVGKSSLINALTRQKVARTSAAPGKTRQANFYRIRAGRQPAFYLVDLPGYGYARGGAEAAEEFDTLARAYFARITSGGKGAPASAGVLVTIDSRHPGLPSDLAAWRWLQQLGVPVALVATKIDKLTRAERVKHLKLCESAFETPVLAVSAHSGEGLNDLWTLIARLPSPPPSPPRT